MKVRFPIIRGHSSSPMCSPILYDMCSFHEGFLDVLASCSCRIVSVIVPAP
jgi:hypothetical protein